VAPSPFREAVSQIVSLQNPAQPSQGEIAAEEVDADQPGGNKINEVVKEVCVCDTVNGGVNGDEEEKDGGEMFKSAELLGQMLPGQSDKDIPCSNSGNHGASCHGLNKKDKWHYG